MILDQEDAAGSGPQSNPRRTPAIFVPLLKADGLDDFMLYESVENLMSLAGADDQGGKRLREGEPIGVPHEKLANPQLGQEERLVRLDPVGIAVDYRKGDRTVEVLNLQREPTGRNWTR